MAKAIRSGKLHHAISARTDLGRVQSELHRRQESRLAESEADVVAKLRRKRLLAEAEGSWVAAAKYLGLEQEAAREALAETQQSPEEMTPDEWRQRIETDARSASLEDLEVYVQEYYDRSSLEPVAEDGVIRLVRVAR